MKSRLFFRCVEFLIGKTPGGGHEGGYVDNPRDTGGKTNMGITQATLSSWLRRPATEQDVRNLTREMAIEIYHSFFWMEARCDELPPPLAYLVFDSAVNNGVGNSARFLQTAVGAKQDGAIGPKTIAAVRDVCGRHGGAVVMVEILARRIIHHSKLSNADDFGLGWSRRLAALPFQAIVIVQEFS